MKSAVAVTLSIAVAVWVDDPLVPVIVSAGLPIGVPLVVVTFRVEEPEPVTEEGAKDPVAPVGSPLTLKSTEPLNPLTVPTLTE